MRTTLILPLFVLSGCSLDTSASGNSVGASAGAGGVSTGGVNSGGVNSGGVSSGGISSGGVSSGGVNSGGVSSGGVSSGGVSSGGVSSGGVSSGGVSSGGVSSGGVNSGGVSSGGVSSGGGGGGGLIPLCGVLYSNLVNPSIHKVCEEKKNSCLLSYAPNQASCAAVCATGGGECLEAGDNAPNHMCTPDASAQWTCKTTNASKVGVCLCSRGCGGGLPCLPPQTCQGGKCL